MQTTRTEGGYRLLRGRLVWLLALGCAWVWVTPVVGQPPEQEPLALDPVVVTATVAPTPLSQASASVTVIDREQIEAILLPTPSGARVPLRNVATIEIVSARGYSARTPEERLRICVESL